VIDYEGEWVGPCECVVDCVSAYVAVWFAAGDCEAVFVSLC
jgi:hypothetical protein